MKFRLFQTVLVAATLVTWVAPLQAFNTKNETTYTLQVWSNKPIYFERVKPNTTSNGWYYKGTDTSILLYVCISPSKNSCIGSILSCPVPPHGQQIVTYGSSLSVTCPPIPLVPSNRGKLK
jgi:hypothetical protein